MADSLVLKGVKSVRKQTGSELLRLNPKRGGDTHQIKRWWTPNTVSTVYVACTLFKCTQAAGDVHLAVETSATTTIRIDVGADFTFSFYNNTGVKRAALLDENMKVIEHYVFPAISGGKIMTVTPPGAAIRPVETVPITFSGQALIAGTPTTGETLTATAANFSGGVGSISTNLIFQVSDNGTSGWSTLAANASVASGGSATYTLQPSDAGKYIRASYQVTDDNETKIINSAATPIIAADFGTRVANATFSYTVGVNNIGTAELPQNVYTLNGVDGPGIAGSVGDSFAFDFTGVASSHPLGIFTDSSKTTPVTVGVTVEGSVLLFEPPIAGTFSYQCINHANMGGSITIS